MAKKDTSAASADKDEIEYNTQNCAVIAHPLASKKLTKKILKTTKKVAKAKHVKRGVKEVVKSLRKGEKGLVILAGDISPIDVISHLPVLCEEQNIPYCYVPSKQALGLASATKRPTSVILLPSTAKKGSDYEETLDACLEEIKGLPLLPSKVATA